MPNDELRKRIFNHVDPSRRDFVKRVLAGAAFAAPVIASFSIEGLFVDAAYAQASSSSSSAVPVSSGGRCLPDPGYIGPAVFQAYVEDTSGNTRVNGELVLGIRRDDRSTSVDVRLRITQDAEVSSAYLTINGVDVADFELHAKNEFGQHACVGTIAASDIRSLCDFDSLLQTMASQQVTAMIGGTYFGISFSAQGPVLAASAGPIIQID
jgi:hypothetical protein